MLIKKMLEWNVPAPTFRDVVHQNVQKAITQLRACADRVHKIARHVKLLPRGVPDAQSHIFFISLKTNV